MDLSIFFTTKLQANDFSNRLSVVSEKIYHADFNIEKTLMEQFGIRKKDSFMSLLHDNAVHIESNTDLKTFLTKIQDHISSLSVLSLTIAFEPNEQILQAVSEWFMLNLHQQVLFDITIDQTIIAGAVFNFKGKYREFSIKPKFDQILKDFLSDKPKPAPLLSGHQSIEHITFGR